MSVSSVEIVTEVVALVTVVPMAKVRIVISKAIPVVAFAGTAGIQ